MKKNENFILREYSRFDYLQFLIMEDKKYKIYKIKYCDASKTK
jgi:hypothetical protein